MPTSSFSHAPSVVAAITPNRLARASQERSFSESQRFRVGAQSRSASTATASRKGAIFRSCAVRICPSCPDECPSASGFYRISAQLTVDTKAPGRSILTRCQPSFLCKNAKMAEASITQVISALSTLFLGGTLGDTLHVVRSQATL